VHKVLLLPSAQKDLDNFKGKIFKQITDEIISLKNNPYPSGCLKLTAEEGYRLRSGNYRILYRVEKKEKTAYIYRIKHRKNAY